MEGSCKYIVKTVADSRQEVALQLGVWVTWQQLLTVEKCTMLRDSQRVNLGPGLIIWCNLSNGKGDTRYFGTKQEILNEIEEEREIVVGIEMRKKNWAASNKKEVKMKCVARNAGIE